jgi:hypothetical protein
MPTGETIVDVGVLLILTIRDKFMCAVSATVNEGITFVSQLSSCPKALRCYFLKQLVENPHNTNTRYITISKVILLLLPSPPLLLPPSLPPSLCHCCHRRVSLPRSCHLVAAAAAVSSSSPLQREAINEKKE